VQTNSKILTTILHKNIKIYCIKPALVDLSQIIRFQIIILLVVYSKIHSSNVTIKYSVLETVGLKKDKLKRKKNCRNQHIVSLLKC
jgi:hypothetical protein